MIMTFSLTFFLRIPFSIDMYIFLIIYREKKIPYTFYLHHSVIVWSVWPRPFPKLTINFPKIPQVTLPLQDYKKSHFLPKTKTKLLKKIGQWQWVSAVSKYLNFLCTTYSGTFDILKWMLLINLQNLCDRKQKNILFSLLRILLFLLFLVIPEAPVRLNGTSNGNDEGSQILSQGGPYLSLRCTQG